MSKSHPLKDRASYLHPQASSRKADPMTQWSSFLLRVGTPAQDVRVLISSASQATWVVLPQACGKHDPTSCPDDRGGLFNYNQSSTWAQNGLYEIWNEQNLGMSGNGSWGNDTLGLAVQGSGGPTLQNQVVAGIVTDNFYLGMFGVVGLASHPSHKLKY